MQRTILRSMYSEIVADTLYSISLVINKTWRLNEWGWLRHQDSVGNSLRDAHRILCPLNKYSPLKKYMRDSGTVRYMCIYGCHSERRTPLWSPQWETFLSDSVATNKTKKSSQSVLWNKKLSKCWTYCPGILAFVARFLFIKYHNKYKNSDLIHLYFLRNNDFDTWLTSL